MKLNKKKKLKKTVLSERIDRSRETIRRYECVRKCRVLFR